MQLKQQLAFSESLYQNHIGFVLYDPQERKVLFESNSDKYFIPASNTKIFTFYTGLMLLGNKTPALQYQEQGDSLIFWGTGDPSFLNPDLYFDSTVYDYLVNSDKGLYFATDNYSDNRFGPGWAWDDYLYTFSSEKSPFPIYANTVSVKKKEGSKMATIDIPYFKRHFYLHDSSTHIESITREENNNDIHYYPTKSEASFSKRLPFKYSDLLLSNLLSDTLHTEVHLINKEKPAKVNMLYSLPTDSLYKRMMRDSDNFIAEQLMLVYSTQLGETMNTKVVINYMKDKYLYDLPDEVVWKDGSGLSRYNLVTPRAIVRLWEKIFHEVEQERLFSLLAIGGEAGTLKNHAVANSPYIYGKTGTLSNNYNLSGFLVTQSGKTLIFSYMNNNYIVNASEIKIRMEKLLWSIHQRY